MNSSAISYSEKMPHECDAFIFLGGRLDHTTTETYAVLVFLEVVSIVTFPITSAFNALVIIAVKTKPRLRTMSNVALACLATTDGIMGVVGQPLYIAWVISNIQGDFSSVYCSVQQLLLNVIRVLVTLSLFHLVLINVERYIAVKHSLQYTIIVTKARILGSSAVAWIVAMLVTIPFAFIGNNVYLIVNSITSTLCMSIVVLCQVVLYRETRRHQKEIAAQQVSVEARQKFLKDRKAFKLTTTVLFFLMLTYSPLLVVRVLISSSVINSVNATYIALFTTCILVILNSLINPVIYCIKIRQFRLAFIAIVFRKSNTQAEEIDMRIFGTLNVLVPIVEEQGREENPNNEQENSASRDNIDEHFNNITDDSNNVNHDCSDSENNSVDNNDHGDNNGHNSNSSIENNNNYNSDNSNVDDIIGGVNHNDSSCISNNNNDIINNSIADHNNNRRNSNNNNTSIENNNNVNGYNNIVDDDRNGNKTNNSNSDSDSDCNNNDC